MSPWYLASKGIGGRAYRGCLIEGFILVPAAFFCFSMRLKISGWEKARSSEERKQQHASVVLGF